MDTADRPAAVAAAPADSRAESLDLVEFPVGTIRGTPRTDHGG